MEVLASDKTGTLTLNQLTLDKEDILAWGNSTKDDVLLMASLSAKWDHNDAIDKAVTAAMGGNVKVRIELVSEEIAREIIVRAEPESKFENQSF
jgi:H+-transporting ATPase